MAAVGFDREQWLAERRTYLGGTDVAAIVGKNKWASPLSIYESKVLGSDGDVAESAEAGLELEPLIRRWFEKDWKCQITPAPTSIRHPKYPFLGANPDGFINDDELLEIKTHSFRTADEWGEEMTDEIPDAYHVQCVWYLGITGRKAVRVVAVDTGSWNRRYYVVEADPVYFEALVTQAVGFWRRHIEKRCPPDSTGHKADLESLKRVYAKDNGETVIAEPQDDECAENYLRICEAIKPLEKDRDGFKARLIAAMGEASYLTTLHGTFSNVATKEKDCTNWELVAEGLLSELTKHDPQAKSIYGVLVGLHTFTKPGYRVFRAPKGGF